MKLTALLQVKNEEWILPAYLSSIAEVVDEIVAIDDGSSDRSRELIEQAGGYVQAAGTGQDAASHWGAVRDDMLRIGRERGGTHFLCLDADEALTAPARADLRDAIGRLRPGMKLSMQWLALWRDPRRYRDDGSAWSNSFKDFAFADDSEYSYSGWWPHRHGRTPGPNDASAWLRLPPSSGAVMHFQFVPWERFQAKQAWYRCAEFVSDPSNAYGINQMYAITLDERDAGFTPLPAEWLDGVVIPEGLSDLPATWHLDEVLRYFDEHGVAFFEPLQIWHVPELRERFVAEVGREPKPDLTLSMAGRLGQIWRSRFASRS